MTTPGGPVIPTARVYLGLTGGAAIPAQYLILGDPALGLLDTGQLAPDGLMAMVDPHQVNGFTCSRGSSRIDGPMISYEAGTASITLINQDGRWDPDNYTGPYAAAAGWTAKTLPWTFATAFTGTTTTFVVTTAQSAQITVGDTFRDTGPGQVLAGPFTVTAIGVPSGGLVSVTFTPAAPAPIAGGDTLLQYATAPADGTTFTVSAADALKIQPGDWVRFSAVAGGYLVTAVPAPSAGFVAVGITPAAGQVIGGGIAYQYQTQLTPMVSVRIVATWAGTAYPLWSGYVTDWDPQYSGPDASYCVVTCMDGLGYLAQDGLRITLGTPVGAGEDAGARVTRILDSAGWPGAASHRDIDTGISLLQGTLLDGPPLSELQLVADSELGGFWMSPGGKAVFRNRHAILQRPESATSQAIFGSGASELPYTERELEHASTRLINTVPVAIAGGVTVTYTDTDSAARYMTRAYPREDLLLMTGGEAQQWAGLILYQNKDPEQWYAGLTVDPRASPAALYPVVLGSDVGWRITARRRPPGMPMIFRDCFIRGITHTYSQMFWQTTWVLQSAAKYVFLILDSATQAQLDSDRLGF